MRSVNSAILLLKPRTYGANLRSFRRVLTRWSAYQNATNSRAQ